MLNSKIESTKKLIDKKGEEQEEKGDSQESDCNSDDSIDEFQDFD
jgi:hypothetical protein